MPVPQTSFDFKPKLNRLRSINLPSTKNLPKLVVISERNGKGKTKFLEQCYEEFSEHQV